MAAEAIVASRAVMAELTEGFEETKPRPSSQASSIRLRRSDMGGMATDFGWIRGFGQSVRNDF